MTDIYGLNFKPGDIVFDLTAIDYGWPDTIGTVMDVDGTNVLVKYESGRQRWKMSVNLRLTSEAV